MHVHIERDDKIAKVWLAPVRLSYSGGFKRAEIQTILRIIKENRELKHLKIGIKLWIYIRIKKNRKKQGFFKLCFFYSEFIN